MLYAERYPLGRAVPEQKDERTCGIFNPFIPIAFGGKGTRESLHR